MAGTLTDFLRTLLKAVTTYYTATFSPDTDLYQILRMYGAELASGSTSLETVRNNSFVITCENSKLFDNFGTYFSQLKTDDQDYNEDLYTSGEAAFTLGPTATILTRNTTTTFITDWTNVSTTFPYEFLLGYTVPPTPSPVYGHPLHQTTVVGNKLYASCYIKDTGATIPYPRIVSYDISTNAWEALHTVLTDISGTIWITLGYPVLPAMGLISYKPYLGRRKYDSVEHLYCFDIIPSQYTIGIGYNRLDLVGVKYSNLNTTPTYTSGSILTYTSGSIFRITSTTSISYTKSVILHNKIYMAIAVKATEPDATYRWPYLVYYDSATDIKGEVGLATTLSGSITDDFTVFTSVVYNNKIYVTLCYGTNHLMCAYDGVSWNISLASPATSSEVVRDMISYNNDLYSLVHDPSSNISRVFKYDVVTNVWTLHYTFNLAAYRLYIFNNYLIISLAQGYIYYLDSNGVWQEHSQLTVVGNRAINQFETLNNTLYGLIPFDTNMWASNEFLTEDTYEYYYTGDKKTFVTNERMSIPSYRKQLDFLLESAMNGGTLLGMNRAVNAFTLINPDIRELYRYPGWKLKATSGSVTQLSTNTWRFNNVPIWKDNLWLGATTTLTSGSIVDNKVASAYIVLVNDNNVVTVGSIYNDSLLYNLRRPN